MAVRADGTLTFDDLLQMLEIVTLPFLAMSLVDHVTLVSSICLSTIANWTGRANQEANAVTVR